MSSLATIGTCSYNGFTWPVEHETVAMSITPVQDAAKRTIIYSIFELTVNGVFYVVPPGTLDDTIATVRRQLTAQGGAFTYQNKGLGDIRVNVPGQKTKDVIWGPVPKNLRFSKLAGNNAVDVVWTIQVAFPDCDNAAFQSQIMEFNYKLDFDIDESGYSTRNYSGFVRIPATRNTQADRTIPDSADAYREKIYPILLYNFRRASRRFSLSDDKTRLDFSIVDVEMPINVPPPGCISAKASHTYSNVKPGTFLQWNSTITADYEIARGYNPIIGLENFMELIRERIGYLNINPVGFLPGLNIGGANPGTAWDMINDCFSPKPMVLPVSFSASEPEIYGKTVARFSFTYSLINTVQSLMTSGLWTPILKADWNLWSRSLSIPLSARGIAGLKFNKADDVIIDLCLHKEQNHQGVLRRRPFVFRPPGLRGNGIVFNAPDPGNSWILYENFVFWSDETSVIQHVPLANAVIKNGQPPKNGPGGFSGKDGFVPPSQPDSVFSDTIIQQRSAPALYIIMKGRAMRAGFEIPCPQLVSVGGVPVTLANRPGEGFSQGIVGNAAFPVYAAGWTLRYAIPRPPMSTLTSFPNPTIPSTSTATLKGGTR